MKITDIKTWAVNANWRSLVYLKVYTDEGIIGVGEATIERNTREVVTTIASYKEILIGKNPLEITALWQQMYMYPIWKVGAATLSAMSGIEMALWDIMGKKLGVPVYQLLGGKVRDKIKTYANGWFQKCHKIGDFAKAAVEAIEHDGYQALMWDPFGAVDNELNAVEMKKAIECVRLVREAIGPYVDMAIEFHFKFDAATAIRLFAKLEEFAPFWFEDPLRMGWYNVDVWQALQGKTRVPLMEGGSLLSRWGYRRLLEQQYVQHIKADIQHCGGLAETIRVAALAEMYGITCSPHNVGGAPSRAATLHFAACVPNFLILEQLPMFTEHPAVTDVSSEPLPEVKDGYMDILQRPGLGVDLDHIEEIASKYPYEPSKDAPKLAIKGLNTITINPITPEERRFMDEAPPESWSLEYS